MARRDDEALTAELVAALGAEAVTADPLDRHLAGTDASMLRGEASVVCWPRTTAEVQAAVRIAIRHRRPFVTRGSGTGLAGGAVPTDGAVVIVTTRMNAIGEIDRAQRRVWVQPGVINLDLSRAAHASGLYFAPDPSSQQACSVGGNVANNAGGPHCLSEGVTSAHVLAVEVVLPDGEVAVLGGAEPDPVGYDLRGAFVGSEGTLGVATRILVRLNPLAPDVGTLIAGFDSMADAAATVSDVIASGLVPAALELMDRPIVNAVEDYVGAGLPREAAAVLLAECEGLPDGVSEGLERIEAAAWARGATSVEWAADDQQRSLWWKARKNAFGAVARVQPNYYLHDTVVPRSELAPMLERVYEIAERHGLQVMNVFHAGDGNLHPLLLFDARQPGVMDRVHAAGAEIVAASLAAGGVLSGEHGIGLEKRGFMRDAFDAVSLDLQARLREAFDPNGRANPDKILPEGSRCRDVALLASSAARDGLWA